jgi:ribosomal protection tetracycline resistance protein
VSERKELNLGILAHVDAGKTTLTERLLYEAGIIRDVGSVDAGTTQTDTLALERQRGITIKSAGVRLGREDAGADERGNSGHGFAVRFETKKIGGVREDERLGVGDLRPQMSRPAVVTVGEAKGRVSDLAQAHSPDRHFARRLRGGSRWLASLEPRRRRRRLQAMDPRLGMGSGRTLNGARDI